LQLKKIGVVESSEIINRAASHNSPTFRDNPLSGKPSLSPLAPPLDVTAKSDVHIVVTVRKILTDHWSSGNHQLTQRLIDNGYIVNTNMFKQAEDII